MKIWKERQHRNVQTYVIQKWAIVLLHPNKGQTYLPTTVADTMVIAYGMVDLAFSVAYIFAVFSHGSAKKVIDVYFKIFISYRFSKWHVLTVSHQDR